MNSPLVSICIPVFNRESLILDAIKSAQNQSVGNIEIVVVDNASTDKTYERVYQEAIKDKRIKLHQNKFNIGALKNFYKAVEFANSKYVVLLGSDDWLEHDFIESRLNGFQLYPDVAIISGPMKVYEQINGKKVIKAKYNYSPGIISYNEVVNNFYRKFLVSYFCMFKKIDVLNNFYFDYHDPYKWGVYKKGLGLDLINCFSIINKNPTKSIYYSKAGFYCFRNHSLRESEEIASREKGLDKTIVDFTYNTFLFGDYLRNESKTARIKFIQYKFIELNYEILRGIFTGKKIKRKTIFHLREYMIINQINKGPCDGAF
jgi:glycosyltransferase involved in cell wall biosynthesis